MGLLFFLTREAMWIECVDVEKEGTTRFDLLFPMLLNLSFQCQELPCVDGRGHVVGSCGCVATTEVH